MIFKVLNFIVWPLGILIPLLNYLRYIYPWNINYNSNYLTSGGCQPNLTFVYANNGTRCLVDQKGRSVLSTMYFIMLLVIIATQFMFVCIYVRLRRVWKGFQVQADTSSPGSPGAAGYVVAARHSRETVISSVQFSVTGFIYIVSYFPLIVKQTLEIYYGPPTHSKGVDIALTAYFLSMDNFVGLMNVLFYGVFSSKFRKAVFKLLKTWSIKLRIYFIQVCNPIRRSSTLINDSRLTRSSGITDFETESDTY